METHFDFCVVCTSQYESSQKLTSGNGAVKRERFDHEDFQFIAPDRDEHRDSAYDEGHLEPLFVLGNILKVATEKLEELNSSQDPLAPGNGLEAPLCPPCRELARQFHETLEKVSRLQMILSEIQGKFMEKIQQNKDVKVQGSSSSWKAVRHQVVLNCFGDDHIPITEESDDVEEKWHFGETRIKSEVADESDEEYESNFTVPTFPLSSSVLHFDSTSSLVDDEGVSENMSRRTSAHSPSEAWTKVFQPRVIRRRRKGNSKNWSKKKGMTALRTQVLLECAHCTYSTMHMSRFTEHQQVHDPLSGATSSGATSGIHVLPTRMKLHLNFRHPS